MKLVLLLSLMCVFATNAHQITFSELTQIWQRFLLKHIDECIKITGANRVQVERLLPYGEFVDDPKLKCFTKCAAKILYMVEPDAETHHENFLDILNIHDPEIRKNIISECFEQINKEDECSQVFHTSECVYFTVKKALTGKGKQPIINTPKVEF